MNCISLCRIDQTLLSIPPPTFFCRMHTMVQKYSGTGIEFCRIAIRDFTSPIFWNIMR